MAGPACHCGRSRPPLTLSLQSPPALSPFNHPFLVPHTQGPACHCGRSRLPASLLSLHSHTLLNLHGPACHCGRSCQVRFQLLPCSCPPFLSPSSTSSQARLVIVAGPAPFPSYPPICPYHFKSSPNLGPACHCGKVPPHPFPLSPIPHILLLLPSKHLLRFGVLGMLLGVQIPNLRRCDWMSRV